MQNDSVKPATVEPSAKRRFAGARGSVTEIVYTWPDGREEVRYRRTKNSPEALALIEEVLTLQAKHGPACPYSYRDESPNDKVSHTAGRKPENEGMK